MVTLTEKSTGSRSETGKNAALSAFVVCPLYAL
jgi:hypothetical protein